MHRAGFEPANHEGRDLESLGFDHFPNDALLYMYIIISLNSLIFC